MKRSILVTLFAVLVVMSAFAQGATQSSGPVPVPASMSISESLNLTVAGGPLVIPSTQNGVSNVITLTTTYNLIAANHAGGLQYTTWFSGTNALTGTFTVPSSALSSQVNGGTALACSQPSTQGSVAGATCTSWTSKTQAQLTTTPSGTDNNTVAIQYTGATLTNAGTASGTFNVLAYSL